MNTMRMTRLQMTTALERGVRAALRAVDDTGGEAPPKKPVETPPAKRQGRPSKLAPRKRRTKVKKARGTKKSLALLGRRLDRLEERAPVVVEEVADPRLVESLRRHGLPGDLTTARRVRDAVNARYTIDGDALQGPEELRALAQLAASAGLTLEQARRAMAGGR